MGSTVADVSLAEYAWFGTGLLVLVAATIVVARSAGVGLGWTPLSSLARATVQLAVVALLLRGILTVPLDGGRLPAPDAQHGVLDGLEPAARDVARTPGGRGRGRLPAPRCRWR